jgi:gliding motility-associated-like protein
MIDCFSNTVRFTNSSYTNRGSLLYFWDFGDGNTSNEMDPQYTFSTSGIHQVSLGIMNPPSACSDYVTNNVESFSPPLVGIDGDSTYCPDKSVVLRAFGAYDYTWSNGSKADSIEVFPPGGEFWLLGRSSTGCFDLNYTTITEEPDWEFLSEADTILCVGDSSTLMALGANEYNWNTGDTINSILVKTPGLYSVTGKNKRGCEKTNIFNVIISPPPNADFTLSDYTLSGRENTILGNSPAEQNVQYFWDLGDGSTYAGPAIQHPYQISNGILWYTISLSVIDSYGCTNSSSDIIDVIPFIPNVFTPNNDGINDIFMPDIDLLVFDRNGTIIYRGFDGWDGTYKGQSVDPDTYFYSIFYNNRFQLEQNKKGYVTLLR